jgi:hypothetical protein
MNSAKHIANNVHHGLFARRLGTLASAGSASGRAANAGIHRFTGTISSFFD